ncbi:MAG: hypothetical protein ACHQT9_03200 [Candidatus Saccharimonadales bacterium]
MSEHGRVEKYSTPGLPGHAGDPVTGAIVVNSDGEAYTDLTRQKESVIRSERLDTAHPVVEINLETIVTEQSGIGISIIVQDFGLPPRMINIKGDFTDTSDIQGMERSKEHYQGAPKKLQLQAHRPGDDKTFAYDDRGLPAQEGGYVTLTRGNSMIWAHDGDPSDQRTGYIHNAYWGLVAERHEYGTLDFNEEQRAGRGDIPFIGMTYDGNILSIYSLDDVHAEVQYQQVRSLEDELSPAKETSDLLEEVDIEGLVSGLVAGDTTSRELLAKILDDRKKASIAANGLASQLEEALLGNDRLETLLAINKRKLGSSRHEVARLTGEVRRLKQGIKEPQEAGQTDNIFDILGAKHATEADPYGHCSVVGLDPSFLFALSPDIAVRVVKGVHRGLAMGFHSDRNEDAESEEAMKAVNNAVDEILGRIERGYWGKR